jgi:hypothetical protein
MNIKLREKCQSIGIILGAISFIPSWLGIMWAINFQYFGLGVLVLLLTTALEIIAISLCTWSLEEENKELKNKLKEIMRD